ARRRRRSWDDRGLPVRLRTRRDRERIGDEARDAGVIRRRAARASADVCPVGPRKTALPRSLPEEPEVSRIPPARVGFRRDLRAVQWRPGRRGAGGNLGPSPLTAEGSGSPMMTLNARALAVVESLLERADELRVAAHRIDGGGRVIDLGINVPGG